MNRFANLTAKFCLAIAVVIPANAIAQPAKISAPLERAATQPAAERVNSLATTKNNPATAPTTTKPQVATNSLPPIADINLVLKLKERKVYVYKGSTILATYPVAIGRKGRETPTGEWYVMETLVNPGWTNFNNGKYVAPGPNNPMGTRWIGFWTDGQDSIGFHGTPQVNSIGKAVSNGCVRMYDKDVQALYALVKVGTIVRVVE